MVFIKYQRETILLTTYRAIESLTLNQGAARLKGKLMLRCVELIYYWFLVLPKRQMLQAAMDLSQKNVEGEVTLKPYKSNVIVMGRQSEESLYYDKLVTFEDDQGAYNQKMLLALLN